MISQLLRGWFQFLLDFTKRKQVPWKAEPQALTPRVDKPKFLTQISFEQFALPDPVREGLKDMGFTFCTPIQAQVLPVSLNGRDVAGQAQTGTGKTAAFLVTVLSRLLDLSSRRPASPGAMIVAPTRELALQIHDEACKLGRHTGLSFCQVVGGIDYRKQAEILREGPDVVICTPGRIIDYMKQGIFDPKGVKLLVIDEADRLFDLGFVKDMRYILRRLPPYKRRQSMLFSATLSYRVLELTYDYMNLPEFISVAAEDVTVKGVEQTLFHIGLEQKLSLLLGILKMEDWHRVLIFVNTKAGVNWLAAKLKGNGFEAEGITGDLPQRKRFQLMERFRKGQVKILVATDVASRGIHVEDITHVINYDLPQDPENYIHRIGRTARAGKTGRALSLACERYVYHLESIENLLGFKIPVLWPKSDWFIQDRAKSATPRPKRRKKKSVPGRARHSKSSRKYRRPRKKKNMRTSPLPRKE
jgi:ATP-dependent RNA helicase RhlB